MRASVTVRVPGSTSNLGAGFDCVGMAVDRWLTLTAHVPSSGSDAVAIERRGTLAAVTVPVEQDLCYRGFLQACEAAGRRPPPGVHLSAESDIPVARGLGSSAAAAVAGAVAASALLGVSLERDALAQLCTTLEGHPDNVTPAVFGGAVLAVSAATGKGIVVTPLAVHSSLAFVFAVPGFVVETKQARAVLPASVSHATAVTGAARAAALIQGLSTGDERLLAAALDDVLHVPFRRTLVRGYDAVVGAARRAGAFGATLSGSGPTIVAVASSPRAAEIGAAMVRAWGADGIKADSFVMSRPTGGYEIA
jgi:homoserine kinase